MTELSFVQEIEAALQAVQSTLDRLTQSGQDTAAFELARAQYTASIRSSWPGNLGTLVGVLEKVLQNPKVELAQDERAALGRAVETFRKVKHP